MKKKSASVAIVIVITLLGGGAAMAADVIPNPLSGKDGGTSVIDDPGHDDQEDDHEDVEVKECGDLSIHFLMLGNKYTGDSVYISYGDIDIIIDAGSRTSSANTIVEYVSDYIKDGKIEFVIATHAHQDHIAGFYSSGSTKGVLDSFDIGTVIDYPLTDSKKTTVTRSNYENTVKRLVDEKGTVHYNALQCYNNEGGAQRVYELGPGVTMEILYQPYYESVAKTENDYSVCLMIKNGEQQYLFTGDLEKAGEDALVDFYQADRGGLGKCALYKGGHHGSSTSSNVKLMAEIKPDYVIVCTCAGTEEYSKLPSGQFPTQQFIDRVAPYTDQVYVTTVIYDYNSKTDAYGPLNGNVIFSVKDGNIEIICSADTRILKETDWFKANRVTPAAWA